MSEEEKNEQENGEETPAAEATEETPAEEPAAEEPSAQEAPADEAPAGEEEAPAEEDAATEAEAPAAPADDAEAEPSSPKQIRKLERSRFSGPARPQRAPEERAAERAEQRRRAAASRRRHRASSRAQRGERGQGTVAPDRRPGSRKVRQGTVVSNKADKTITVQIEVARRHPAYEKIVRRSTTLHAHDESNEANEGDVVRVVESRPLSRTKRWRLVEILERAR
jgi:small subunit ribosomal protein S17